MNQLTTRGFDDDDDGLGSEVARTHRAGLAPDRLVIDPGVAADVAPVAPVKPGARARGACARPRA